MRDPAAVSLFAAVEPFPGTCPRCAGDILVVEIELVEVVLEVQELLPEGPCATCDGTGRVRETVRPKHFVSRLCYGCNGSGRSGQPIPQGVFVVDEHGNARRLRGERREGEAPHLPHRCDVAAQAA